MDALANIKSFLLQCSWLCYTMHVSCFRKTKKKNVLITALDTLDLGADVDHEKFMNTLSESTISVKFHSGILRLNTYGNKTSSQ